MAHVGIKSALLIKQFSKLECPTGVEPVWYGFAIRRLAAQPEAQGKRVVVDVGFEPICLSLIKRVLIQMSLSTTVQRTNENWSGYRESNPSVQLGRLLLYH